MCVERTRLAAIAWFSTSPATVVGVCCLLWLVGGCHLATPASDAPAQESYRRQAYCYFCQGLAAEAREHWQEAAACFDKAATLDPRSARAHAHLAWCLVYLSAADQALAAIAHAEKYASSDDYLLHFDIAKVYHLCGRHDQARRFYETCLSIFPAFLKGKVALSLLLQTQYGRQ